jgi:phosphate ABC transporter phosphate-binding protein
MATSEEKIERREPLPRRSRSRSLWIVVAVVVLVGAILAYGAMSGWFTASSQNQGTSITLVGAGATFPYPLIAQWSSAYHDATNVQVNYQSIGSGGGIQQITAKTVDFGATDAPLTPERAAAPNLLHIPETIGAVTFVYNLAGVPTGLNLTGPVIADIFLGTITKWNDPAIVDLNPTTNLPDADIFVVHRSDGSGTTFVWTDYLSKVSTAWHDGPGKGKSVNWPVGLGAKGNEGVAGVVAGNANAAGYVELAYASIQKMSFARVKNQAGNFVLPTLDSTAAAAAAAAPTLPHGEEDWGNVSIVNPPGADSYPIASFTYLLVYRELNVLGSSMTQTKAKALVDFLWWVIHDGQDYSAALVYVPLPAEVVALNEQTIGLVTLNGQAQHT